MNLPRLLNAMADCFHALRLAGFSPDDAERIVKSEFHEVLDTLYPQQQLKPYPLTPRQEQEIQDEYHRYHDEPRRNQ